MRRSRISSRNWSILSYGNSASVQPRRRGHAPAFRRRPRILDAAVGPGIGAMLLRSGPEVAAQFGFEDRHHLDSPVENRRQLIYSG
jgi:hypothetical protein